MAIVKESELKPNSLPINKIIWGDALTTLKKFPSESVDCVITSPPYWGLRYYPETEKIWGGDPNCDHEWNEKNYCVKCGAWQGQLGLEPSPELYVEHLIEIFREVKRVLKPHGNVFVVIDDVYSGSGKGHGWLDPKYPNARNGKLNPRQFEYIAPRKSLCLVPELFAIHMVYRVGFILRQKLIWVKKVLIYKEMETIGNAMPSSIRDRNTHTFEFVYHFTKEPKYYYDQLRLPYKDETIGRMERAEKLMRKTGLPISPKNKYYQSLLNGEIDKYGQAGILTGRYIRKYENTKGFTFADNLAKIRDAMREQGLPEINPLGANAPDVVQINPEPLKDSHYAPFPTKLVEVLIKVGCPEQVCKKCGKPRERIVEKNYNPTRPGKNVLTGKSGSDLDPNKSLHRSELSTKRMTIEYYTAGWTDCGCNAGWTSGIVLDPFLGSGTVALVALQMGRRFVGVELNREYCEMAYRRIKPYLQQKKLVEFV